MIKIGISVALEKRLREWDPATACELVEEIIGLIESSRAKQANRQAQSGVGYTEILRWFREAFGNGLAVPPAPSDWWIGRQVTRAREIGLKQDDVARIAAGAKRLYPRGPGSLNSSSGQPLDLSSNMSRVTAADLVKLLGEGLPTTSDEVSRRLDCESGTCSVCKDLFTLISLLSKELDEDANEFGEVSL